MRCERDPRAYLWTPEKWKQFIAAFSERVDTREAPILILHPTEKERYEREFPGIRVMESFPVPEEAIPRNRHERRKAAKKGRQYAV